MRFLVAWIAGALAVAAGGRADEALLPDGQRVTGELRRGPDGRLLVGSHRLDQVIAARFVGAPAAGRPAGRLHRAHLRTGESLTGELLGLDRRTLRLRTAWAADPVAIPRALVLGLSRPGDSLESQSLDQDAITSTDGDESFGIIAGADPEVIELQGRAGSRRLGWSDVRAVHLRFEPAPPRTSDGEHVRAWIGPHFDPIDGVVLDLDARRIALRHAGLGVIVLARPHLRRLAWQFFGQRWEVDVQHHLGGDRLLPLQAVPKDRLNFKQVFPLPAVSAGARLGVRVANLLGPGDGTEIAKALGAGGLQTRVQVNGRSLDDLNRHGERSSPRPRWLSLDLPADLLRTGDNVIELRQVPDAATGRHAACDILGFRVDVPRD